MSSKIFKIITGGEGGVGKTTLLYRYIEGKFITNTKATLGVDFFWKIFNTEDEEVNLQLWDFGGQKNFRHILKSYASGANGALLLFDLTNKSSLENINEWVDICRENEPNLPIVFLGTKLDLTESIVVDDKDAILYKDKYFFLDYIKISSKTNENVNEAFNVLVKEIMKNL